METQLLNEQYLEWFVEEAAVSMLVNEVRRPELVNIPHLYKLAERGMQQGTAWIALDKGKPVGALGSLLVPNTYNPELKSLAELFWYVSDDYRMSRAGFLLFKAFEKKAKESADEAILSLLFSSKVRTETLEKRGFIMEELAFRKRFK